MRFLALPPDTALALLAGVAGLIVLLYLLKPRPRRVVVASNLIWNRVLAGTRGSAQRWRWLLSLLLALLTGLALALALTRPEVRALGGEAKRIALIMDNSPSMAARTKDGESRWLKALAVARGIINNAGVASEFLISDTMGYAGAPGYVERSAALAQLQRLPLAASGRARFPVLPGSSDINAKLERYLVSDGVAEYVVPEDVLVRSVFEAATNVALIAFDARALPNDPTRYQAFLQLFNASTAAQLVTLEVSGAGDFSATRELEIAAGETRDEIIDVSNFAGGALRATATTAGDAFSLDDRAYALVQPHSAKRVLLVTRGNAHLQDALRLLPGVKLTTVAPPNYRAAAAYDAFVFDRFAPPDPPPGPVLLLRPPQVAWLPEPGQPANKPTITKWDDAHPLALGLSWRDLQIENAVLANAPEAKDALQHAVVLARGSGEGAIVTASEGELRWVKLGFALQDTNLQFQADFPVFLGGVINWLTAAAPGETRPIGPIQIAARDAAVTDIDGKRVQSVASGARTVFAANRPNVFTVKTAERESRLVANVLDPRFSDINNSALANEKAAAAQPKRERAADWHPWLLLLWLAAILLVLEALLYHRRVTV